MAESPSVSGKRARTRAKLIEAALEVVAAVGLKNASLDAIAARAGMTKGAIYSNFAGRAGLVLAIVEARGLTLRTSAQPEPGVAGLRKAYAAALVEAVARAQSQAEFIADLQAEAVRDADLKAALGALHREGFRNAAGEFMRLGMAPAEADRLAVALQAAALGLLLQSLITPEAVTAELIGSVIDGL